MAVSIGENRRVRCSGGKLEQLPIKAKPLLRGE